MKMTNEEYGNQSINTFDYVEVRNLGGAYDKTPKKHIGMTLRQHYAGLAMQGLLANSNLGDMYSPEQKELVKLAISYSDALISQLNKGADSD